MRLLHARAQLVSGCDVTFVFDADIWSKSEKSQKPLHRCVVVFGPIGWCLGCGRTCEETISWKK